MGAVPAFEKIPSHIAIIMDGNGRWAMRRNKLRTFGHNVAVRAVQEVMEACVELQVHYLTLFAFSTENWARPQRETQLLIRLLERSLRDNFQQFVDQEVSFRTIGDLNRFPKRTQETLRTYTADTAHNTRMRLTLALSYSGRWDLTQAMHRIAKDAIHGTLRPEKLSEKTLASYLSTHDMPDPELLIRTSGEQRLSNFLLWPIAYTELYVTDTLWPDFRKKHLYEALKDFQNRERRFGRTGPQPHAHSHNL